MKHTAAGLFRIFTGFPFNHYTERLREPMLDKGTNSLGGNQKNTATKRLSKALIIGNIVYFWIIHFYTVNFLSFMLDSLTLVISLTITFSLQAILFMLMTFFIKAY